MHTLAAKTGIGLMLAEGIAGRVNLARESIVIAVIDSGADYLHPDLPPNLAAGWDFTNSDVDTNNPADQTGHGTYVGLWSASPFPVATLRLDRNKIIVVYGSGW